MKKIFVALALLLFASESWAPAIMTMRVPDRQDILKSISDIQKDIQKLKRNIDESMQSNEAQIKNLEQEFQNCKNQSR